MNFFLKTGEKFFSTMKIFSGISDPEKLFFPEIFPK